MLILLTMTGVITCIICELHTASFVYKLIISQVWNKKNLKSQECAYLHLLSTYFSF